MTIHAICAAATLLALGSGGMVADLYAVPTSAAEKTPSISCARPLSPGGESAVRTMVLRSQESRKDRVMAQCLYFKGFYDPELVHRLRSLTSPEGIVSRLPHDNAVVVVDAPDQVRTLARAFEAANHAEASQ